MIFATGLEVKLIEINELNVIQNYKITIIL